MSEAAPKQPYCPMTRTQVVDAYFMEHRARLLDVAAFLDRIDRAGPGVDDYRMAAYRAAIGLLLDGKPERTRRILESLSDTSTGPIPAAHVKGATGAFDIHGKGT